MSVGETDEWASQLARTISHAIAAHNQFGRSTLDAVRFHDHKTPYAIHLIWCAMTLLAETKLSEELRRSGSDTLLWHKKIGVELNWSKPEVSVFRQVTFFDGSKTKDLHPQNAQKPTQGGCTVEAVCLGAQRTKAARQGAIKHLAKPETVGYRPTRPCHRRGRPQNGIVR
ncbi:MAG: hypothetical protein M0P19_10695 [Nevskia sp.]|jgi:hypothetical protein|nr:hypothetical protein [Nevskia sp.]MCK9383896.1 hypothetical protein [Nevskia sp.]